MQIKSDVQSGITAKEISLYDSLAFGLGSKDSYGLPVAYSVLWGLSQIPAKPLFNINPSAFEFGAIASLATIIAGAVVARRAIAKETDSRLLDLYPDTRALKFHTVGFRAAAAATLLATGAYAYFHPVKPAPVIQTVQTVSAHPAG